MGFPSRDVSLFLFMLKYTLACLLCCSVHATEPNAATKRWWSHVQALSNDGLLGRDTGSEGYDKAARYVANQFERAGLKAAGEKGGYFQSVPMHKVAFRADQSKAELVGKSGARKLEWLRQISVTARAGLPQTMDARLVFGSSGLDVKDKIVVQIGRGAGPAAREAAGTLTIDAAGGAEPARWPVAYSVAVTLADTPARASNIPVAFRYNREFAEWLFEGSGHTYKELLDLTAAGKPLPAFELATSLRATMRVESSDLKSDNILAVLPGSDPVLAAEYVVVSAHLDGYGVGEPWNGDGIYNGAFDDAAYVATLIDFAQRLHESGVKLKRSILFAVVTGEEKGLLGSKYYTQHPTIPNDKLVANINLDQLRPIFPLTILTTLALDESTLGETVKRVAAPMNIRIQPDPEPERNLLRRSDHINFMQVGVPAVGFIFGYEKGTAEEAVYRRWYAERYHSPKDDLNQPWVPEAAAKFNDFFAKVVETIANDGERPHWRAGSPFAH